MSFKMEGASLCSCGHVGDVPTDPTGKVTKPFRTRSWSSRANQHGGLLGHGACEAKGCPCMKFSWVKYLAPRSK